MATRLTGDTRRRTVDAVRRAYNSGCSVREIAEQEGVSYGTAHRLLVEAQVTFRPRGGSKRKSLRGAA